LASSNRRLQSFTSPPPFFLAQRSSFFYTCTCQKKKEGFGLRVHFIAVVCQLNRRKGLVSHTHTPDSRRMGLCKCRVVTNLFCFEHKTNVCEKCIVSTHPRVRDRFNPPPHRRAPTGRAPLCRSLLLAFSSSFFLVRRAFLTCATSAISASSSRTCSGCKIATMTTRARSATSHWPRATSCASLA